MTATLISVGEIRATYATIAPHIRRTPIIEVDGSDFRMPAARLVLKLESLQHAGSFKARGAFTSLLTREIPRAGVVAASGGNHGAAVAFAAMKLKVHAKIFVPGIASPAKIQQITDYGAELVIIGERYEPERLQTRALEFPRRTQHFRHTADRARPSMKSDLDEVPGAEFLWQLQQSAIDGDGL